MLSFTSRKPLADDEPFQPGNYLFITSGTFQKRPFIAGDDRKQMLCESLDFNCYKWDWRILAFAILNNHYHLVVQIPHDVSRIAHIIQSAHSYCAYHWRREDPSIHTRIWWNFWDTPLEDREALIRHINYVHANPSFHGCTKDDSSYPFSSYADYLKESADSVKSWEQQYPASKLTLIDSF